LKTILEVFCLAFLVTMLVRIIEMSIQFDWVDILWAFLFLIGALICGAGSKATDNS
jgi:hypothetical protein